MIIDCIADLHSHYPQLDGGDLLIVAGDLTKTDTLIEQHYFMGWLYEQNYKKKIFIAGNHDNILECVEPKRFNDSKVIKDLYDPKTEIEYLCDSGTEFDGLKIWGSPWTKKFEGMNPKCMAFTVDTDEELSEKWKLIPNDIDILVTHSPPCGILDTVDDQNHWEGYHVGSSSLSFRVLNVIKPKLHVFGHIHECGGETHECPGETFEFGPPIFINASHVNEYYEPVNKPIRVELSWNIPRFIVSGSVKDGISIKRRRSHLITKRVVNRS